MSKRKKYKLENKDPEIKEFLKSRNIPFVHPAYGIVCYPGGVKTEWNTGDNCLVVGYRNSKKDQDQLRKLVRENYGADTFHTGHLTMSRFCEYATVEDFIKLVDLMLNLPFEIEKKVGGRKKKVEFMKSDYFMNVANLIRFSVENKFPMPLDRGDLGFDDVDDIVRLGYSENAASVLSKGENKGLIREHIVPCIMIIDEAIQMVEDGKTSPEIAGMIKSNLAIVVITEEEAYTINSDLGYLTTMPDNWEFGDDIFARLHDGKITLINY